MAGLLGASAWAQSNASISRIEFTSNAGADNTYPQGSVVALRATFTEPVFVTNSPGMRLFFGTATSTPLAVFRGGSGSRSLRFEYQVRPGDSAAAGLGVPSNAITLGARDRVVDGRGFNARLTHAAVRPQEAHRVDGVAPRATAVNVASPAGTYSAGEHIDIDVVFTEDVVAGAAELLVTLGETGTSPQIRRAQLISQGRGNALRFRYTVQAGDQDGDGISVEAGALVGGTVADTVGNRAVRNLPPRTWATHKVGVAPAATVERVAVTSRPRQGDTYGTGETIQVGVTFDTPVYVSGDLTLNLSIGERTRAAAFADGSGTPTLLFRYAVQSDDRDDDGISIAAGPGSLSGGSINDGDGVPANRAFEAVPSLSAHKVAADDEGDVPVAVERVAVTSRPRQGDTYRTGETIQVGVTFDAPVSVTGDLALELAIGASTRAAAFADGSGTPTLLFRYTVQAGDRDDDGISIAAGPGSLTGGSIDDEDGVPTNRAFAAVPSLPAHKVAAEDDDDVAAVERVAVTSRPRQGDTYRTGETIRVGVTFDAPVHVSGDLTLDLTIGARTRAAAFTNGSGTPTLLFRYTVQSDDRDEDGISIGPGPGSLTGGSINDGDGAPANRAFAAVPSLAAHKVAEDDVPVAVERVQVTSRPRQGDTYRTGETIQVGVTFDAPVSVTGDLALELAIGASTRAAAFADGSGTPTLLFRYTVQAGDRDDDGISIAAGPGSLTGGSIDDEDGVPTNRAFAAVPSLPAHKVAAEDDDDVAAVERVAVTSRPRQGDTYRTGETIRVGITFDAPVYVSGNLTLDLSIGARTRTAAFQDGSGSRTLLFRYTVQAGDRDDDGISIGAGPGSLTGGAIEDGDGVPANRAFTAVRNLAAHKVAPADDDDDGGDGETPRISNVAITSSPAARSPYRTGDAIVVTITFSETVTVTGSPRLMLAIGANQRAAAYNAGSGSTRLTFRYVVRSDDQDEDGISIGPGPGSLTGGTIRDADGNNALRNFTALPADPDHRVGSSERAAATGVEIASTTTDGYQTGDVIHLIVTFDNAVHVRGSPALALVIGEQTRRAVYTSGSGTTELSFHYTVQSGDLDKDGISVPPGSQSLTGGEIQDQDGMAASRDFEALPDDADHKVAAGPSATGAAITSSPASGDTYTVGEEIEVSVTFDGAVQVADAGQLKLAIRIGGRNVDADFIGGSGTATLWFRYTVQRGDQDRDGISIDGTALRNGRLTDAAGTPASTEFPALPNQRGHKVGGGSLVTAALPRLVVGGPPTEVRLANLLTQTGLGYRGSFETPEVSPPNVVRATLSGRSTGTVLTVLPFAEGTANVAVTARDAAITLVFSVSVGTDAAEAEVLEDVLASVGRGLLASASDVIGGRLKTDPTTSSPVLTPESGGESAPPAGGAWTTGAGWAAESGGGDSLRWLSAAQRLHPDPNHPQRGMAAQQLLSSLAFDMPLLEQEQGGSAISVWGAGDVRRFDGEVEEGSFDGDMELAYLGLDARVGDWVAGAAVAHSRTDVTYDSATATGAIEGGLETELTAFHPYARWRFNDRMEAWAIFGFGEGEVTHTRDGLGYVDEPSDLTMTMGVAGARGVLSRGPHFGLILHGDAGMIRLETEEGALAISDLSLNMSRARLGLEASYRMAFVGGGGHSLTPFLNLTARYDGGDGEDGVGVEVAGGVRYKGPIVSFEAQARSLVWHGADGYSESGASAAIIVEPGSDGRGLRLSLAPRWGASADAMDVFWRHSGFASRRGWHGEQERGWGWAGRLSYGFGVNSGLGTITPFADFDFAGSSRRTRFGVGYGLSSPWGIPLRIDLAGERMEDERGADHRFLLTGEVLF